MSVVGTAPRPAREAQAPGAVAHQAPPCRGEGQETHHTALPPRRARLAQELLGSCIVKNTFVEALTCAEQALKEAGLARSFSEPAFFFPMQEPTHGAETGNRPKPLPLGAAAEGAGGAAESGAADEEVSTDDAEAVSVNSEEEGTSSASSSSASCSFDKGFDDAEEHCVTGLLMQALIASHSVAAVHAAMSAEELEACQEESLAQADCLLGLLRTHACRPTAGAKPPPARLKATAEPWRPVDPFSEQTRLITASTLGHIRTLPMTLAATMSGTTGGWKISVTVREQDLPDVECLLSNAKAALLGAARLQAKAGVQVLGSCRDPFHVWPQGFSLRLGLMKDQETACWDAFSTGCCTRGRRCRWEHPARWDYVQVAAAAGDEGADP